MREGGREGSREGGREGGSCLVIIYLLQPDNSTAQYVLRMMISQHKFYRSELEGTPGITWMRDR